MADPFKSFLDFLGNSGVGRAKPEAEAKASMSRARAKFKRAKQTREESKRRIAEAEKKLAAARASGTGVAQAEADLAEEQAKRDEAKVSGQEARSEYRQSKQGKGPLSGIGQFGNLGGKLGLDLGDVERTGATAMRAAAGDPTATIDLALQAWDKAKKQIEKVAQHMKAGGEKLKEAWKSETVGGAAGGIFGAGEEAAAALPLGMGKQAGQVMKFGRVIFEATDKLRNWTNRLQDSNLQFAEFSHGMARVQAFREVQEMRLSRDRGERRAQSAQQLAESQARFNRRLAPYEDRMANFKNRVGSSFLDGMDKMIQRFEQAQGRGGAVGAGADIVAGGEGKDFGEAASILASRRWVEAYGLPLRFGEPPG